MYHSDKNVAPSGKWKGLLNKRSPLSNSALSFNHHPVHIPQIALALTA